MDLLELRNELDGIDKQIVELYEKRMNVCGQVAEYKIETGKRVFDKEREKQKLEAVRALTHNDFNAYGVTELFEQIMAMSRKLQYRLLAEHDSVGKLSFSIKIIKSYFLLHVGPPFSGVQFLHFTRKQIQNSSHTNV